MFWGCKTNPPISPPEIIDKGELYVSANVDGALIYIDNVLTGKVTPDTLELSAGVHLIKVEKTGYTSESKNVTINKNSTTSVNFSLVQISVNKIVLIEDFANVSCTPCVVSNKILESLINSYGTDKILIVKIPTNFPSSTDPFYLLNKTNSDNRIKYYNIISAPSVIVDGIERPIPTDSLEIKNKINDRSSITAEFKLTLTDTIISDIIYINVTLEIPDTSGIDFTNLVLHTVVIEKDIEFSSPPGSNGETRFYNVMRAMLPDASGEHILYEPAGKLFNNQAAVNSNWNSEKLITISFIQNKITKEILNSASSINK
jgi:hypothetical protein